MIIAALQLKYRKKLFSFLIKTVNVTALIQKKKKKKRVTVTNRRKCQFFSLQLLRNAQYNFNNFGFSKHTQHTHFTFMNTRYSLAYVRSKYNILWFCGTHQRSKSLSPMRHLFFLFTIYYFHQYLSYKKLLVFL